MPYETLGGFIDTATESADAHLYTPRQEIKVLFYTDYPSVSLNDNDDFGVSLLERLLNSHQPAFATVSVTLRNRNAGTHASCKLDAALNEQDYDQLWLFGYYQANTDEFVINLGGPQNELDSGELKVLEEWMQTKGVLITGDHANAHQRRGVNDPGDHSTYLGLGNALGSKVPRAGQLRKWKGLPTSFIGESRNTQVAVGGGNLEDDTLQHDNTPQALILEPLSPQGLPHPIFLGSNGSYIRVFPDHNHEGEIVIPETLNNEWGTAEGQSWKPGPKIIASGTDNRPPASRKIAIMAAYDGDPVPAGRIVADSTWHHYFNRNLKGFTDNSPNSVADQLGQFYSNLVVWLSPLSKRRKMARAMYWWLATNPRVLEESYNDIAAMGSVARKVLSEELTLCEIQELLQVLAPTEYRPRGEMLYFPTERAGDKSLPSQEMILGQAISLYRQASAAIAYNDSSNKFLKSMPEELIEIAYAQAFELFKH